jgi:hypothetical protein
MDIWQRGTSFSNLNAQYAADRWCVGTHPATTTTRQASDLTGFQYFLRTQRNSGNTATNGLSVAQSLETVSSIPLAGKTVTLSFYARAGANYSATSNALSANLISGTGTDQNIFGTYTGAVTIVSQNVTLTTSWQRFSITGTVGSTATEVAFYFNENPTGTAGANDYYDITGIQLEVGSVATPFSRAAGTLQGELALCQRYYYRVGGDGTYNRVGQGVFSSTTTALIIVNTPTTFRVAPTAIDYSTLGLYDGGGVAAVTSVVFDNAAKNNTTLSVVIATGGTANRIVQLLTNGTSAGYLGLSAEL